MASPHGMIEKEICYRLKYSRVSRMPYGSSHGRLSFVCVGVHLAGQLHDLSTWLANSNLDGSKMFSLFHFLIFSLVNCGSSKNALANMNPSPRLRRRDSHFTTTVRPTTLPATVLVNCGFVFGSQRAKYICGSFVVFINVFVVALNGKFRPVAG